MYNVKISVWLDVMAKLISDRSKVLCNEEIKLLGAWRQADPI